MTEIRERHHQYPTYRRGFEDEERAASRRASLEAYLTGVRKGRSNGYREGYADGFEQACRAAAERQKR